LLFEVFYLLSHLMLCLSIVCGLKQFSIAQTILTKSPMYLTNLLGTILSRIFHSLKCPLALLATHLTFVINLDLLSSSVVCCFLSLSK
jgi:hypothetical protein